MDSNHFLGFIESCPIKMFDEINFDLDLNQALQKDIYKDIYDLRTEIEKDFFGNILKPFEEITRHPLVASEEELIENPRSRSAKLRIAEKK